MKKTTAITSVVLILGLVLFFMVSQYSSAANVVGGNYKNVTVLTKVHISNSKPEVLSLAVYQDTNSSTKNITLSAGLTRVVTCNATVRDWDGYNDIVNVNATLWDTLNSNSNAADDNNTHYTNANCTNAGNGVNYTVNYICTFNVYYYANNGTWMCNATAMDTFNKTGYNTNTTVIYPLYALNVTDGIDYGNVAVEDYSTTQTSNVTNFGNQAINISVEGYGTARGDGLAMNCTLGGNISIANERFSADIAAVWGAKVPLTSGSTQIIPALTIAKQTVPSTPMVNSTYWQLYIPPNPGGNCTGYVIFQAEVP